MVKLTAIAAFLLVTAGMVGVALPAYSQEKTGRQQVISVSGEIVSVDLAKSTVVVKTIKDAVTGTYEEIALSVLPETKLAQGDTSLKLSDLKAGDKVTVDYVKDVAGKLVPKSISVKTQEK